MNEILKEICLWMCALVAIKAVIIGSDFSFISWLKHGKVYTDWYFTRGTFSNYLKRIRSISK